MTSETSQISLTARRAMKSQDWSTVAACANEIIRRDAGSAEGYFLAGIVERVSQKPVKAAQAFEKALDLDLDRYDAAVELANQYSIARRNGEAAELLTKNSDPEAADIKKALAGHQCRCGREDGVQERMVRRLG